MTRPIDCASHIAECSQAGRDGSYSDCGQMDCYDGPICPCRDKDDCPHVHEGQLKLISRVAELEKEKAYFKACFEDRDAERMEAERKLAAAERVCEAADEYINSTVKEELNKLAICKATLASWRKGK